MSGNLTKKHKPSTPGKIDPNQLIAVKKANPNLTHVQLAKLNNVSASAITQCLNKYGIDQEAVEAFKVNRGDIFAGIQETVAASLTLEDIKAASVRDRTILLGTLYDKERLERGQSTQNVASILASSVVAAYSVPVTKVVTIEAKQEITDIITDAYDYRTQGTQPCVEGLPDPDEIDW